MRTMKFIMLIFFTATLSLQSQFLEDALRLSQTNGVITARSGGLGVSFHGISDDFAAVLFNPAGLSAVHNNEINFAFGFQRNTTETEIGEGLFETVNNFSSNNAYFNHIGLVSPFKTKYGNAALAIGYVRENNFTNNYEYNFFNQNSSYISSLARSSSFGQTFVQHQLLGGMVNNTLVVPITDSLQQDVFVQEEGGIHNIIGGAGFDLSENFSLGFTLVGKWGSYQYSRDFTETDTKNKYDTLYNNYSNVDFYKLEIHEMLKQDISGISGSVGLQGRISDRMKIGASVKFPTFYNITEDFSFTGRAQFDNGDVNQTPYEDDGATSYNLTTPWVYSAGASFHLKEFGLTFSAGVEYSDVSQIKFSDATDEVLDLNSVIVRELVGQTKWGIGVEYDVPLMPFVVRSSFTQNTSPYGLDVAGATEKEFSFGAGVYLASNIRIDGLFRWRKVTQMRTNYGQLANDRYTYTPTPLDIGMQLTYRY